MPIDYQQLVGQVRLLIPDMEEDALIFTDEQIEAFVSMSEDNFYLAAALACETIAFDNLLLFKVNVRSDDGFVTSSETSKQMLARAKELRRQAYEYDSGFAIVGGETELLPWGIYGYRY